MCHLLLQGAPVLLLAWAVPHKPIPIRQLLWHLL
jgi:hypothetical protein